MKRQCSLKKSISASDKSKRELIARPKSEKYKLSPSVNIFQKCASKCSKPCAFIKEVAAERFFSTVEHALSADLASFFSSLANQSCTFSGKYSKKSTISAEAL